MNTLIYRDNKKTCMKKVFVVLVVLFIGILFAGCTSQQSAPAATPTPTPEPTLVATTVPTTVPTPVATPNVTANVTAVVTAVPTAVATPNVETLTFTKDLTISPVGTIYVPAGTVVSWANADPYKPHGVKSLGTNSGYNFGTVNIPYKSMYNVTFSTPGAYDYVTVYQPYVSWKIIVMPGTPAVATAVPTVIPTTVAAASVISNVTANVTASVTS